MPRGPPPEPQGQGQKAPNLQHRRSAPRGEGAHPRRLGSFLLREPRLGPWRCPTGICGCAQRPQSPQVGTRGSARIQDPGGGGGGGGKAKVTDRTQVLKNREASASQSGNLGVTPLAAPRGIPAAPLPGEYSNPNTENKEAGPMGKKLGIDTCYADCQAHACRCARGAVPCLGAAGRGRPGVDAGVGSRTGGARGGSSASPGAAKGPGAREPLGQGS